MTGRGLDRFDNLKRLMALGFEPIIQKGIKGIAKAALDALSKALSQEPPPEQLGIASDQCQNQLTGICWMQKLGLTVEGVGDPFHRLHNDCYDGVCKAGLKVCLMRP